MLPIPQLKRSCKILEGNTEAWDALDDVESLTIC